MLVELQNIELGFGGPPIIERGNLVIEHGARICLLGRNGSGKSTLLKLLAGAMIADDGARRIMPGLKIGWLSQEVGFGIDGNTIDSSDGSAIEIATGGHAGDLSTRKILDRLSVDPDTSFASLSGGMKRRTLLARALAGSPDLLLLDEPTNHLDTDAIEWLEHWLKSPGLSVMFISHDRRFIDNVASEVVEIDRGVLHHGRMGYRRYLQQREARIETEERERAQFNKVLDEEEAWIRGGIKARRTRNEGRVRRLQEMRRQHQRDRGTEARARASIRESSTSGKIVLDLDNVSFSYDDKPLINSFSFRIMRGDRIGITGVNGSGKTTLINLMLGKLTPQSGTVTTGTKIELAEFDQHRAHLDESLNAADNVAGGREFVEGPKGQRHIISYMKDYLFTPEKARAPIHRLSGGERARLMLARLFSKPFNLLVMDEPTNDLDIETLELLEEILLDFDGTLILISHDRAFIDNVTTSMLHLDGSGHVAAYEGGYTEYERVRRATIAQQSVDPNNSKTSSGETLKKVTTRQPRLSYKFKLELEKLPGLIEQLETDISELHNTLSHPDFYTKPTDQVAKANRELEDKESALSRAYKRWEELEGA
ncbi:MAG: ABC transporter ATP-binding protein [marine bacterium B5-7]|nr:MAG: ABC transporter ATP-binding protein [marine bacterium B5-7]